MKKTIYSVISSESSQTLVRLDGSFKTAISIYDVVGLLTHAGSAYNYNFVAIIYNFITYFHQSAWINQVWIHETILNRYNTKAATKLDSSNLKKKKKKLQFGRVEVKKNTYQWPVFKIIISWKLGASSHEPSGTSTSTLKPCLYPRDSSAPPLPLSDHL